MSKPVKLHVYDLSNGLAAQLSMALLGKQIDGIWHTGVVLDGHEYFFGQGIQRCRAGATPFGTPMQVVDLGSTEIPEDMFREFLEDISTRFNAATYNLLNNNCNNFSDEVADFLVGSGIPAHITGLPQEVAATPFGQMIMPMLQPALEERLGNANAESIGGSSTLHAATPNGSAQARGTSGSNGHAQPQGTGASAAAAQELKQMDPEGDGTSAQKAFKAALEEEYARTAAEGLSEEDAGAEALKRVMIEVSAGLVSPPC